MGQGVKDRGRRSEVRGQGKKHVARGKELGVGWVERCLCDRYRFFAESGITDIETRLKLRNPSLC